MDEVAKAVKKAQEDFDKERKQLEKKISDLEMGKGKGPRGSKKGKRKDRESSSDSDDPDDSKRLHRKINKMQKQLTALTKKASSQDPSRNKDAELPFEEDCTTCPDCDKSFKTNRAMTGHYLKFHRNRAEQRYIPPRYCLFVPFNCTFVSRSMIYSSI